MRVLQISDTHLGAKLNARGPRGWSRAHDHHQALERALQPAFRGQVDLVLHCGDVFDRSRPPRRWVVAAGELLTRVADRVPVIGIAGNHDRRGIQRWLPHRALGFHDQPVRIEHAGLAIGLVPFVRDRLRFRAACEQLGQVDLLAIHQAPHGSAVGRFRFRAGVQRDAVDAQDLNGVPWVACGHIHPRQVVQLGRSTVVCGGSTERTAFSEAPETKGAVIWDFSDAVPHRFVDHATRPMDHGRGALVRCTEQQVEQVRSRGQIAVVRQDRSPHAREVRSHRRPVRLPLFAGLAGEVGDAVPDRDLGRG